MTGKAVTKIETMPGPGEYLIDKDIKIATSGKFGNEKKKSVLVDNPVSLNHVPGPGAYSTKNPQMSKTQTFSFGKGKRMTDIQRTPGPGEYIVENPKASQEAYSIGKGNRGFKILQGNDSTPGPGNYSMKQNTMGKGPKYTIGKKTDLTNKHPTPGPGEYIYEDIDAKKKTGFKIGDSLRTDIVVDKDNTYTPGPGMYNSHKIKQDHDHAHKFGKDPKNKGPKDLTPGPGHYYIPCSVVDIPDYMTVGANFDRKNFKFV